MNLRELNYILIPRSADTLERWSTSKMGRVFGPFLWLANSLTWEGRLVFVATLVTAAAGMDVTFSRLYLVFCGLFGLLASAVALRPLARLEGVGVQIRYPTRVTSGEAVTFTAVVRNDGPRAVYALRILGPFLPWDGQWEGSLPSVLVLEPGEQEPVTVTARFSQRGRRVLGRFSVASVWPLGLVLGRRVVSERVVLNVVPRVTPVAHVPVAATVRYQRGGGALSSAAGESFELLGVRDYRPGDRIRDLHARSWARAGRPVVREYQRERSRRVAVVLHTQCPRFDREHFEPAVQLCAGLLGQLLRQESMVSLVVLGDPPVQAQLGGSVNALDRGLDLLSMVEPVHGTDGSALSAFLAANLYQLSTAFFVFVGWDDERAAVIGEVRRHGISAQGVLVTPDRTRRQVHRQSATHAEATGIRVVRASEAHADADQPLPIWGHHVRW